MNCAETCGNCRYGDCDKVTGRCYGGCAAGYLGDTCKNSKNFGAEIGQTKTCHLFIQLILTSLGVLVEPILIGAQTMLLCHALSSLN